MSYIEDFNKIKLNCYQCSCAFTNKCENCEDGYSRIQELCKRADYYNEHDLRQNPLDVPSLGKDVLFTDGVEIFIGKFRGNFWVTNTNVFLKNGEVLLWREIENFNLEVK